MPVNTAAWIRAKHANLEVAPAPYTSARENEIVVENHAVAVNPIDWIKQTGGDLLFSWIKYPFVLGTDLAGDVVEVGKGVSRFRVGDRVLAHAVGMERKRNSAAEGAFQAYTVVPAGMAAPIPSEMSYESAAVLPLGCSTAACGLFQKDHLGLDYPSTSPRSNGKTLLVWGGSTSVGSNAIQLAVAAGYDVVTTASRKNFAYVKTLGASQAFDYHDKSVVEDVIAAFKGRTLAGALAVGAGSAEACVDVVDACQGNKFVSMATFPISFAGKSVSVVTVMRQFLWFSITMWIKSRRRRIRTKFITGDSLLYNEVSRIIYTDFLPKALAEQRYVAAPDPQVVGAGLDYVQTGLEVQKNGVSAAKVVISLPSR